eukprot:Gb_04111 [translate_table: standard]
MVSNMSRTSASGDSPYCFDKLSSLNSDRGIRGDPVSSHNFFWGCWALGL